MLKHAIITGGAGFIGSHLVDRLLGEGGWQVTVVDNFHPFTPRALKEANLARHRGNPSFRLVEGDILDDAALEACFRRNKGHRTVIVHMAARAGVRQSMLEPLEYHRVNVTGTLNVLEAARKQGISRFILASSSSVYGEHPQVPWRETTTPLQPLSPYGVSKLAAEAFCRVYAKLHGLDVAVLRFFTVYGPRQRPDLAIHDFFSKISAGVPIHQFGDGSSCRDYTYVGDIVNGVRAAIDAPMRRNPGEGAFEIFNIGNSKTIRLHELISAIEHELGRAAIIKQLPAQPGDLPQTYANVDKAREHLGYLPVTTLKEGLHQFAQWYNTAVRSVRGLTFP